jgi:hypothetical protein
MNLHNQSSESLHGQWRASIVSIACFLRGLPLFFRATPKTPLRVLCLIAFDTLHVLRNSTPLPRHRVGALAKLLDFAACTNAVLDHKRFCRHEYQTIRQSIENAGITSTVDEYLRRLQELERRRPLPGGDRRRVDEVGSYRENVARFSLGTVAAIALGNERVEDGIRAIDDDHDLATLFRIVMLCQIIDDVLDYAEDVSAGLPSFLTAAASLADALAWTADAARSHAQRSDWPRSAGGFPFRAALFVVAVLTNLLLRTRRCRHQINWAWGSHQHQAQVRCRAPARIDVSGEHRASILAATNAIVATAGYPFTGQEPREHGRQEHGGQNMDSALVRKWRRGALALGIPGICLLLVAVVRIGEASSRALWHSRATGVVTDVERVGRVDWRLTIEYEVAQQTFQIQPASHYSERAFDVGQQVTILYPPDRPQLGILNLFREQWQVPVLVSIVSLALLAWAWKAKTGLSPTLHSWCGVWFLVLGGIAGATVFALLCAPVGLDILSGGGPLVKMVGTMLVFVCTVPTCACAAFILWNTYVPARCPHCSGAVRVDLRGMHVTYTCSSCGASLLPALLDGRKIYNKKRSRFSGKSDFA